MLSSSATAFRDIAPRGSRAPLPLGAGGRGLLHEAGDELICQRNIFYQHPLAKLMRDKRLVAATTSQPRGANRHHGFRIVHHGPRSPRKPQSCYVYPGRTLTLPLKHFLLSEGVTFILSCIPPASSRTSSTSTATAPITVEQHPLPFNLKHRDSRWFRAADLGEPAPSPEYKEAEKRHRQLVTPGRHCAH